MPEKEYPSGTPEGEEKKELTVRDIQEIASPDFLKAISRAAGKKFRFMLDENLGHAGATDIKTGVIKLKPSFLETIPPDAIEGLLSHEVGHHAPEVVTLDEKMTADLAREDIIPDEIAATPEEKAQILQALYSHLCNVELDCWLESFMSRGAHIKTKKAIESLYGHAVERTDIKTRTVTFQEADGTKVEQEISVPLPEQLCQLLVGEDRYPSKIPIRDLVDPEVYRAYRKLKRNGAIETLNDRRTFENYFASDREKEKALERKFLAHQQAFLPAWLELYQKELERREEKKKNKGEGKGEEGVLTPKQIEELIKQLSEELDKLGEQYKSKAPTKDEGKKAKQIIAKVASGEGGETKAEPKKGDPMDSLAKQAGKILKDHKDLLQRGLAENAGIRIESVRMWEDIKQERREEIESAAAVIADVFLEDRRKRIEFMRREGEVVPGLEYEYISAVLSGDASPQTHMKQVQNPDFLETEIEFIQDTSGSMSGEPIRKCVELQIILAEAFKKVRKALASEQLLDPKEEQPLRMGVTKFETSAERVKKLEETMDDEMEMKIVDELTKGGGGTDEEQALEEVYGELTLHQENILKIMVIMSDGEGNRAAVQRIMQQIEDDNEVIVAAVGLGSSAKSVIEAYTAGLRKGDESNIHAFEEEDPSLMLPDLLEFIKDQVKERRRYIGR